MHKTLLLLFFIPLIKAQNPLIPVVPTITIPPHLVPVPTIPPSLSPAVPAMVPNHILSNAPPAQVNRIYSSILHHEVNRHVYNFYPYHHARYYYSEDHPYLHPIHPHRLPQTHELPHVERPNSTHPLAPFKPIYHGLKNQKNHELATHHYGDHPRVVHTTRNALNIRPLDPHPDHIPTPAPELMHYPYHHPTGHHSAVHTNPTNVAYHVDGNNHGVGVPGLFTFWYMCETHNCQG